jgi:hypothetical protein
MRSTDFDNLGQIIGMPEELETSLSGLWADFNPVYDPQYYYSGKGLTNYNLLLVKSGPTNITANTVITGGANIICQFRNASYAVDFTFREGVASTTISKLELEPILDYSDFTRFSELPNKGARAYVSMFTALATLLSGEVAPLFGQSSGGMEGGNLSFVNTGTYLGIQLWI